MILQLITGQMGLPIIDTNMVELVNQMGYNKVLSLFNATILAKSIGASIALGVGANECYQMMLGRRAMDVMKILHIIIISLCITFSGEIVNMAKAPGNFLGGSAKMMLDDRIKEVNYKQTELAVLQEGYLKKLNEYHKQLELNKEAENAAKEGDIFDKIVNSIDEIKESIGHRIQEAAILAEQKIVEYINTAIRFIGEVIYKVSVYSMLLGAGIFMNILAIFAPLMFAISLSPHYKSAWSQWLSKFISISLWPFVAYVVMIHVQFLIEFYLDADIDSYMELSKKLSNGEGPGVGAIGLQGIGTTCMNIVAFLIGARLLAFVPEVASWLMPGGVSSGAGSMASMGTSAASTVGGAAVGGASSAATFTSNVAGTMNSNSSAGIGSAIAQNTALGRAYDAGRARGNSGLGGLKN